MIIFSLLVLILFSSINGMIDPYVPEVLDDYEVVLQLSDGSLPVKQKEVDLLYIVNPIEKYERNKNNRSQLKIDLTKETFYQDQNYTVGNVSRAINYLNGKKNLLDLSVEQQYELLHCADSLASDGVHKEVVDLAVTLYKDVQKGSVDEGSVDAKTQYLFSSIFNTNSSTSYETNGYLVRMINITGRPTALDRTMIPCLIKNTPYLSLLKVNGFFMPVLLKGTLTNPTPPNGCTIDLSNNEISEIEQGAVEWWNKGQLILNNNPLTEESIKRLQQDTRMPLSKHLANSWIEFCRIYRRNNLLSKTLMVMAVTSGANKMECLFDAPNMVDEVLCNLSSDPFVRLDYMLFFVLPIKYIVRYSVMRAIHSAIWNPWLVIRPKYFPLKLKIGNSDEYKPMFDVPLD